MLEDLDEWALEAPFPPATSNAEVEMIFQIVGSSISAINRPTSIWYLGRSAMIKVLWREVVCLFVLRPLKRVATGKLRALRDPRPTTRNHLYRSVTEIQHPRRVYFDSIVMAQKYTSPELRTECYF
jgi:hypothetical protein